MRMKSSEVFCSRSQMDRKKTLYLSFIVAVHAGTNVVVVVDIC